MEAQNQFTPKSVGRIAENRHQPRYRMEVDIRVDTKTCGTIKGNTVDVSESGISAILKLEVPVGEMVELEFTGPFGPINVYAMVSQRNAFRYGFQFVETQGAQELIKNTCRSLALEQSLFE